MRKCEKDDNQDNTTIEKRKKKAMHAPIRKARQYQYY